MGLGGKAGLTARGGGRVGKVEKTGNWLLMKAAHERVATELKSRSIHDCLVTNKVIY